MYRYCLPVNVVVCSPPCVNGACVKNDTCSCNDGFEGEKCTVPGDSLYSIMVTIVYVNNMSYAVECMLFWVCIM